MLKEISVLRSNEACEKAAVDAVFPGSTALQKVPSCWTRSCQELWHDGEASKQCDEVGLTPRLRLGEQGGQL